MRLRFRTVAIRTAVVITACVCSGCGKSSSDANRPVAIGNTPKTIQSISSEPKSPVEPKPQEVVSKVKPAVPPAVRFTDVTASAGIRFQHFNGAGGKKLLPETMGSGVAVLDYDRDGKADLLFINSCPWPGATVPKGGTTPALYRNKGDGTFEDVTEAAGLAVTLYGMGTAVGDIDNDGYPDVFITAVDGNVLFHNVPDAKGGRTFRDITKEARVRGPTGWPKATTEAFLGWKEPIPFPSSATFLDYDGDGRLDLFVCYYLTWSPVIDLGVNAQLTGVGRAYVPPTEFDGALCALYRNIDGTRFEDVSAAAGIQVVDRRRPVGKALGVVVCDPDNDGWPDLAVANDTTRNFFFHNVTGRDGGRRFEETGLSAGVAYGDEGRPRGGMGIDWGEYHPGKNALLIVNFANEPNTFLRLDDPKKLQFTDIALAAGIAGPTRPPLKFGAFLFDYDLDGRLDFLTCNGHLEPDIGKVRQGQSYAQSAQLFWNAGGKDVRFASVRAADAGDDLFTPIVGRGSAYLDFDGDGDLDIVLTENNGPARLLRNDQTLGRHWVRLELLGDGKRTNCDAIGAQVTVEADGRKYKRYLAGARGYLSQSEHAITVGLSDVQKIDRVTVQWPGKAATTQEWKDLRVDSTHQLQQAK
jgi:enediyne biosynthesis protein E4